MYHNRTFNDVNDALPSLLTMLDSSGHEVKSRAGLTKELTHIGITLHRPLNREILLPGRKPNIAAQIAETAWVLAGRQDIGWLGHYLPRAKDFSDDGYTWRAGYGARLREWEDHGHAATIDQFRWVVEHLKEDPASRRAVMSIWDPLIDTQPGKDIPCNDWLSFSVRDGCLDLHVAVRSNDVIWGWSGINQFEWSTMLEVVAGLAGVGVAALHFSTTSFHIYDRHWNKSTKIQENAYLPTGLEPSPRFDASRLVTPDVDGFDNMLDTWFEIEKGIRNGDMQEDLVNLFPEPMFQSWLRVLQWWWSGEREYLSVLENTRLERATQYAVQPPERNIISLYSEQSPEPVATFQGAPFYSQFITETCTLHDEKHAAYGDSWKRRGEMLGIMANIARKIDRLGGSATKDETSADTATDLFVYLAKYRVWIDEQTGGPILNNWGGTDTTLAANEVMLNQDFIQGSQYPWEDTYGLEQVLETNFTALEKNVRYNDTQGRSLVVDLMLGQAYRLARTRWEEERKGRLDSLIDENPACRFCGGLKSNHVQGGSRWSCQSSNGFEAVDEYRGADVD